MRKKPFIFCFFMLGGLVFFRSTFYLVTYLLNLKLFFTGNTMFKTLSDNFSFLINQAKHDVAKFKINYAGFKRTIVRDLKELKHLILKTEIERPITKTLPIDLVNESDRYNEKNDCAVKALAIVCKVSYAKAHRVLEKHGRKKGHGTNGSVLQSSLKELGFKLVRANGTGKTFKTYKPNASGDFLIMSKSHVVACTHGIIRDWSNGTTRRVFLQFKVEKV